MLSMDQKNFLVFKILKPVVEHLEECFTTGFLKYGNLEIKDHFE